MELTRRGFLKALGLLAFVPAVKIPVIGDAAATVEALPSSEWIWTWVPPKRIPGITMRAEFTGGYWICDQASEVMLQEAIQQSIFSDFVEVIDPNARPTTSAPSEPHPRLNRGLRTPCSVHEYGRAITGVRKLPKRFDPQDLIQEAIIENMTKSLDRACAASMKARALRVSSRMASKLAPDVHGDERKWTACERYLNQVTTPNRVSKSGKSWYIGIAGLKFLRQVEASDSFRYWKDYLYEGDLLYEKEVGATGDIRWVGCQDSTCLGNEAVIFGQGGLMMIEVEAPHLRAIGDKLMWYGVLGFGSENVVKIQGRQGQG